MTQVIPGSPYDKLGYTKDSKFKYVGEWGDYPNGEVIWLNNDDFTELPEFTNGNLSRWLFLREEIELIQEEPIQLHTVFTPLQKGDTFNIRSDWDDEPQDTWYGAGEFYIVERYLPKEKSYNVKGLRNGCWIGEDAIDFNTVVKAGIVNTNPPVAFSDKQEEGLKAAPSVSITQADNAVVDAVLSPKMVEISSQHTLTIKGKVAGVFTSEELLEIHKALEEIMIYD